MLCLLLAAALLPELWDKGPASPPNTIPVPTPGVQYRMNVASATAVPWIDANGWRFLRNPGGTYYYDVPPAVIPLAMAEAYAYQVRAMVRTGAREPFDRMLSFLRKIDRAPLPALVNLGVIDDGSDVSGEVLNLLSRRNLLFRVVRAPDPKLDLNVDPVKEGATDPFVYAQSVRQRLGDDKRLLRIYGTDVVIARLTGAAGQARLHLLNYSGRKVVGMRVRVRGEYGSGTLAAFGVDHADLADYMSADGATEFTVREMGSYAVVDLSGSR